MKPRLRLSPLRHQFFLSHVSVAVLSIAVTAIFTRQRLQDLFIRYMQQDSIARAQLLADQVARSNAPLARAHELDALTRRWAAITQGHWTVSDSGCRVVGDSSPVGNKLPAMTPSRATPALSGKVGVCILKQIKMTEKVLLLAVPIRRDELIVGVVRATIPLRDIDRKTRVMQHVLVGAVASMLLIAFAISLYWAKKLSDPLREMEAMARRIAAGDWEARVPAPRRVGDEVGSLAESLNRMAGELRRMFDEVHRFAEHQQQLVANVAHELRTPVASILAAAETLGIAMREDPEDAAQFIETVQFEAERLSRLIQDLLRLARIDAGVPFHFAETSLQEVIDESLAATAGTRAGRSLDLRTDVASVRLTCDRDAVVRVVANLLDNAARHTPEGGRLFISARLHDHFVEVSVTDTGEGIEAEHLPHIFERFYRVDASRSAQSGGAGLGLALVREVVEAHGGTVKAESAPGKGTVITFTLPANSRSSS